MIFTKREIKTALFHGRSKFIFAIQEKEDHTQAGIDQDQPLKEKTLLMMDSTPSRENRDVILDVTLFSANLAAVSILKSECVRFLIVYSHGIFSSQNYICVAYKKHLHEKVIGQCAYYYLD